MTTKITHHASRTIATTLIDLLAVAEDVAKAHDALALPASADEVVSWTTVLAQIDALGAATHQLVRVSQERMIPALKAARGLAKTALAQIDTLNRHLTEAQPSA